MAAYFDVLPPHVDHSQIAYHFEGRYESESRANPSITKELEGRVAAWRERWMPIDEGLPALEIAPVSDEIFLLADTRGLPGSLEFEFIDFARASMALVGRTVAPNSEAMKWALERKVCVELDGKFVPLATAPATVLRSFESAVRTAHRGGLKVPMVANASIAANR
jgi:hypothetical protein